jgi:hypothetical protein
LSSLNKISYSQVRILSKPHQSRCNAIAQVNRDGESEKENWTLLMTTESASWREGNLKVVAAE